MAPLKFLREREVSAKARELMEFDADSIRHVVAAERLSDPDVWLVNPDEYEKNGRILRDSESPRMLAYSKEDRILYMTDGCNACARRLPGGLDALGAQDHGVHREMIERLMSLL
jgi:hypothetical protein